MNLYKLNWNVVTIKSRGGGVEGRVQSECRKYTKIEGL